MAKKSKRKQKKQTKEPSPAMNEPWINKHTGLMAMAGLSLAFAIFMIWQLLPTEGLGRALMWGLGFGLGLWLIFGLAFYFNSWVRGRR